MSNSKNKVAFITGASSGIGHASAKCLLQEGFTVYPTARRLELMQDLEAMGAKVIKCDVTSDEDVQNVVDTIMQDEGRIDVLFANAGYCLLGPVELHSSEEVSRQFDVNVVGVGRAIATMLPHMRKQKSGRILITTSGAAYASAPCMPWYPATKHALRGLADGLRMEVKEFGITVSQIEPGFIGTDIRNASLPYLDKAAQHPNASAYIHQINTFRTKWWTQYWSNGASTDTITKAVLHAATSKRPKRYYRPNMDSKFSVFAARFLGYWFLDRLIPRLTIY